MKNKILPIIVIAFGILIRLINLTAPDLWRDEAFSIRAASFDFSRMLESVMSDTAPPLHIMILHYWMKIFGMSELSVRMPSLIFGILTLIAFYYLARQIFPKNKKIQLITLFLATFNPVLVWHSQEARAYSIFLFLALASLILTMKIIENSKNNLYFLLGITTLLGLYTHNLFLFIGFVNLLLITIALYRKHKRKYRTYLTLLATYFIVGIFYLPWFIIMIDQLKTVNDGGFWLQLDPIKSPIGVIGQILTGEHNSEYANGLKLISMILIWITGGALFIGSYINILKRKNHISGDLKTIVMWFWLLFGLIYLYSFKTSFFYIRYLIFLIPPGLIMIGSVMIRLERTWKRVFILVAIVLCTSTTVLTAIQIKDMPGSKAEMTSLVAEIETNYEKQDLILHPNAFTHHAFNVYSDLPNLVYNPKDEIAYFEGTAILDPNGTDEYMIEEIPNFKYRKVWIIYLWGQKENTTTELNKGGYILEETYDYPGNLHLELWTTTY